MKRKIWLLALVAAVLLGDQTAWAQGDFYVIAGGGPPVGTKISSLPYPINNPGFYFLTGDLTSTGSGITVNTDNVTIDLMGFSLVGNGTAGVRGIEISGRSNVEIRNGTVRNFGGGIYSVTYSRNCRIINIRAIFNPGPGIKLVGDNHLVQNCTASNNSGGDGIWQSGNGSMIIDNVCNGNGSNGIDCTSGGNLIGNVAYGNTGLGFNLSLATSVYYVIDRNTVFQNTGGNLNGTPSKAVFGVNAGIP